MKESDVFPEPTRLAPQASQTSAQPSAPIGNGHGPTWQHHWRTVTEECAREFWRGAQMGMVLTAVVAAFAFIIWSEWRGL